MFGSYSFFKKLFGNKTAFPIAGILLIIGILLLWIYKFPFLKLPFFWDEAWSYAPAVWSMYTSHPNLLPGHLPADLFRGHPLWFYFMNACIAKIFGFSPFVLHLFALIIASVFLVIFFLVLRQFSNPVFALLGTFLLLSQEVFVVQSSFLLPEIFVSMLTMVAAYCLFSRKNILYFFSATLLVLTKESGLIITCSLSFAALVIFIQEQIRNRNKNWSSATKYLFVLAIPLLIGIAFYVFQWKTYGWYFYPAHLEMLSFSRSTILQHLTIINNFIFMHQGRKFLSMMGGLVVILIGISFMRSKTKVDDNILKITLLMVTVFVFYYFFSTVNFIMWRYLLPLITIFIFLLSVWSYQFYKSGFRFFPYLLGLSITISLYNDFTSDHSWIDDVSLNYKDVVEVHQQAVDFMETNQACSKKIFTHFLMKYNLAHPELFYIHGNPFASVKTDGLADDADYYIFSNLELNDSDYNYVKTNDSIQLIKRFEQGKAWCEIYAGR